jgi:LemA protein
MAPRRMKFFEKSSPPESAPITGMMMSSVSDATILPNAPPMMTPTARSITLPRAMNSLNSDTIDMIILSPAGNEAPKLSGKLYAVQRLKRGGMSTRFEQLSGQRTTDMTLSRMGALRLSIMGLVAFALSACGINSVPTAEEAAKARWADVQAQYQRRADLVPNLVATVKGAAKAEQATLTAVTEARAKATSIQVSASDLNDTVKMAQFAAAQGALSQSLGRLLATVEAYPDIKFNQNFQDLQVQLEGTENRISTAIIKYNEAVQEYNTRVRTFPDMIGAAIRGAKPMAPYQATSPNADVAPKVDFGG